MPEPRTRHFRSCPLCEAICGLEIEVGGDRVVSIRGDADDPLSRGYLCPKGAALGALHEDPDRLRRPLLREPGGAWREAGWDEALAAAAEGLHRVQTEHGRDAAAIYLGNPTAHSMGAALYLPDLLRALGTRNAFSASSVDQLPQMLAAYELFGHRLLLPVPDLDRTDHLLIFGANPLVSNGSVMTAPDMRGRLRAIQARGGRVVVIDPRRSETARVADRHHFVTPGSDAHLLLAMLKVLLDEGPVRLRHLEAHVRGLDRLREAVAPFTPERAAGVCGIRPADIRTMVAELAAAPSAAVYGRVGVSIHPFGTVCAWAIDLLNLLTGNLDRAGGVMFTTPAFDPIGGPKPLRIGRGGYARWRSRVRGLPEFGRELPVAVMAEEMLEPGPGQIRALLTSAGNPVLSTPNGGRLDQALAGLDFMVSVDFYLNETTRHARVILPPVGPLERSQYDVVFNLLAVRNVAKYSPPIFARGAEQREDWEIFAALERGLRSRRGESLGARLGLEARARLGPETILALGLRAGPHGLGAGLRRARGGISLAKLRRSPHGLDLGPLQPCLPDRLPPRQGGERYLELAPALVLADLERLAATERSSFESSTTSASASSPGARPEGEVAPPSSDPAGTVEHDTLLLIGRRQLRNNNSWMHNLPKLVAGPDRCTLQIHPSDAAPRHIAHGDRVRVCSRVGEVEVQVELAEDIMPGVVCLPHGFGHGRPGVRLSVASAAAGVSINDLTDEALVDAPSGNAALSGVPVTVRPAS